MKNNELPFQINYESCKSTNFCSKPPITISFDPKITPREVLNAYTDYLKCKITYEEFYKILKKYRENKL